MKTKTIHRLRVELSEEEKSTLREAKETLFKIILTMQEERTDGLLIGEENFIEKTDVGITYEVLSDLLEI